MPRITVAEVLAISSLTSLDRLRSLKMFSVIQLPSRATRTVGKYLRLALSYSRYRSRVSVCSSTVVLDWG